MQQCAAAQALPAHLLSSGKLFSESRISAAALCLWGTGTATHVAQKFSLSANILKKGVYGGRGEVEFESLGEIKFGN